MTKYNNVELRELYIDKDYTYKQMAEHYGVSVGAIREKLSSSGIYKGIHKHNKIKDNNLNLEPPKISTLEREVIKFINTKKLTSDEFRKVVEGFTKPNYQKYEPAKLDFPSNHVRFLAFSDCHMGHQEYRPDVMDKMAMDAKRSNCDFAINCGDTIEGMSGRDGQLYELSHIGATKQINYFKEEFGKFEKDFKVYSIEASESHGGWFGSKGNMGLDIGDELQKASLNYKFIGYDEQDLILENGLKIRLRHPGGGTAYAISYHMQKYIESISGGQKPNLLFQGHYHKAEYVFYRNIHGYDAGCLMNQSIYMKKKNTPSHIGYWIVDVKVNKNPKDSGKLVERVTNTFVPFFE